MPIISDEGSTRDLGLLMRALRFQRHLHAAAERRCLVAGNLPLNFGDPETVRAAHCILIARDHHDAWRTRDESQHAGVALQNVSNEHTLACNEEFSCSRAGSRLPTAGGTPDRPGWWRPFDSAGFFTSTR